MGLKWLVELDTFDEGASEGIKDALAVRGFEYKVFKATDYFDGRYNHFPVGESVFFYGSVQVAKEIQERKLWNPGAMGEFSKYKCSSFYPLVGDKMLSAEHVFVPFGDLKRLWPFLQRCFGSETLFVRPDGGDKMFAGQVVENVEQFFEKEHVYFSNFSDSDSMCLVADAYKLDSEYRLLVAGGKVVTGSRYRLNGHINRGTEIPESVIDFANSVVSDGLNPDPVFMLDVCQSQGNAYCLEINSVSSAALYKIDPFVFVDTIASTVMENDTAMNV